MFEFNTHVQDWALGFLPRLIIALADPPLLLLQRVSGCLQPNGQVSAFLRRQTQLLSCI